MQVCETAKLRRDPSLQPVDAQAKRFEFVQAAQLQGNRPREFIAREVQLPQIREIPQLSRNPPLQVAATVDAVYHHALVLAPAEVKQF